MFDKEKLTQRELYYGKNLFRKAFVKKVCEGLKYACVGLVLLSATLPTVEASEIASANTKLNRVAEYTAAGEMDKREQTIDSMSRFVQKSEKARFAEMSYEDKLAYIESLVSRWSEEERTLAPAGFMTMIAAVILSKLNDEIYDYVDQDFEKTIYQLYQDEKCGPLLKKNLKRRDMEQIAERYGDDRYTAKKASAELSFPDDMPGYSYGDYSLGLKNGQYDFYSRCNYGSGNIYNKALEYVEKGLEAEDVNNKLVEVSYKKGYYRSAGLYVAQKYAQGEELSEAELKIFDNMDNLSLKNIYHIEKYSATEVKDKRSFWTGYVDGFKKEVVSPYSSVNYDLDDFDAETKKALDRALDTNRYKHAFYRGVVDGISDLEKRVEKNQSIIEQSVEAID